MMSQGLLKPLWQTLITITAIRIFNHMSRKDILARLDGLEALSLGIKSERTADPLLSWKPTIKQKPFIDSILKRETQLSIFAASNRSGKSQAGSYIGSHLFRFGWPDPPTTYCGDGIEVRDRATSGWVIGLDFPVLRDTIQPKYFDNGFVRPGESPPFIPPYEIAEWRSGDQILKGRNGSIIGFKSAESGSRKFQGISVDWVHFDEQPDESVFDEVSIRIGSRPVYLFITATLLPPEGEKGGVSWLFDRYLNPIMDGTDTVTKGFSSSIYDNPHLPPNEIERLENLFPLDTPQGKIRLLGEWIPGLSGARAYHRFDRRLNVAECKHLFGERRPLNWCWDFNVAPLVSCVVQEIDGSIYVFDEFIMPEGNLAGMVEAFRNRYPSHSAEVRIYGDASGNARTAQTNRSNYWLILNEMMHYPVPVKLHVPEANPPIVSRINAMNSCIQNIYGEPGMIVDPSCKNLIADLEQVLLTTDGKILKVSNQRDSYSKRTHISDALGYYVSKERPIRVDAGMPAKLKMKTPIYR